MKFVSSRRRAFLQLQIIYLTNQTLLNWISNLASNKKSYLHSYLELIFFSVLHFINFPENFPPTLLFLIWYYLFLNFQEKFAPTLLLRPTVIFGTLEWFMHRTVVQSYNDPLHINDSKSYKFFFKSNVLIAPKNSLVKRFKKWFCSNSPWY